MTTLHGPSTPAVEHGEYLELLTSLKAREFIKSFKGLVAMMGRPSKVYSDNGSTFIAAK